MTKAAPSPEQVEEVLHDLHGEAVEGLEPLAGGFWSSAFAYRLGGRELVLRLGGIAEGYEMDRDAMAFDGPDLPVPSVLDVGIALGLPYAVSERHHGRYLEGIRPDEADAAAPAVMRMLAALRRIPAAPDAPAEWRPEGPPGESTWHRWLTDSLVDDPRRPVSGWRRTLAEDPDLDRLFTACAARVRALADSCPERRDVVHGDLLHGNVLVREDASRIEAVFSWKCSVRGDFLYDVAWCTFWGAWHPGIAALDVWARLFDGGSEDDREALLDAAARHHCYELQIGATHLGWYAWTGDRVELRAADTHVAEILDRGPLP